MVDTCVTASACTSTDGVEGTAQQDSENLSPVWIPPVLRKIHDLWVQFTTWLHRCILRSVLTLSLSAARKPKACVAVVVLLSFSLLTTGYFTNFSVDVNEEEMFAPYGATSRKYVEYIRNIDGFTNLARYTAVLIHANGDNVMNFEATEKLFQTLELVEGLPLYDTICPSHDGCEKEGPTNHWNNDITLFREETNGSDEAVIETMSSNVYPDGSPVFAEVTTGGVQRDGNGTIRFATSFFLGFALNPVGRKESTTMELELEIIDRLNQARNEWNYEPGNPYKLEFHTLRSVPDELMRAIANDIPLVPFVFIIMLLFTCLVFYRHDRIQSRSLLGVGSILTIVMSIMSSYGIVFIAGIPFTSLTQILPFVVFGVGLDDTFIITGAYFRTDPAKDAVERIHETMVEVGHSITLTTCTTTAAFCLGCISSIPSIQWLCIYASIAIFVDFIYQISFFVALLVLDEKRIKNRRRDCCFCLQVPPEDASEDILASGVDTSITLSPRARADQHIRLPDRFMRWYAGQLMRPLVKLIVLVGFTAFLGFCSYSATKLIQSFRPAEFMPDDSYAADFLFAIENYFDRSLRFPAYFRYVDQSDPKVQDQMLDFIDKMVEIPAFGVEPEYCWIRDFRQLKDGEFPGFEEYSWIFNSNLTFSQELDILLADPAIEGVFGSDIARDKDGNIQVSRCPLSLNNLSIDIVQDQVDALADIKRLIAEHPINQGRKEGDEAFFAFDLIFFLWEFYTLATQELKTTTLSGIVTVSAIGFLLIPHWSAIFFVAPLIIVLYVDLLGTLQFSGLFINPLTYVCLVLSIGLLVDFNVHILLRYYESKENSREGKVKDTLQTMGASVFVGALSTCLGVIPLAFSTSGIFSTVFISFIAMVTLGIGHGVILLPVVLSICGPLGCVGVDSADVFKDYLGGMEGKDDMSASSGSDAESPSIARVDEEEKDEKEDTPGVGDMSVELVEAAPQTVNKSSDEVAPVPLSIAETDRSEKDDKEHAPAVGETNIELREATAVSNTHINNSNERDQISEKGAKVLFRGEFIVDGDGFGIVGVGQSGLHL